jgi:predicted transglutaminase-like cysteine proteinase
MASPPSDPRPIETPVALAPDAATACPLFAQAAAPLPSALAPIPVPSGEDFLASRRISVGSTPFDSAWRRVSERPLSRASVSKLLGRPPGQGQELLAQVNRWVNGRIEFTRDARLYGQRDFWASAAQTLKTGKGDCEDYVILKYHMLAALGVERSKMYLTVTRDLVRNEDHTVLIVKLGDEHFMLDNATDTVLPANLSYDYRAVMTLSSQGFWVHGLTKAPRMAALGSRRLAYFSDNAVSSARVTGLNR